MCSELNSTIRIRLDIEYDGTCFSGWQIQPGERTVQGEIERILADLCQRRISVTGSGRTDSGVHAIGQVAHTDIEKDELERVKNGLPAMLPDDVAVTRVRQTDGSFHARFDAKSRLYRYRIEREKHPLENRFAHVLPASHRLNTEDMILAAGLSIGENDWRAMAKEGGSNSDWMVNVMEAQVTEDSAGWTFLIRANRFLRGMVRIWTGTVVQIGSGSDSPDLISRLLETGDRSRAGMSLPAKGLILMEVVYS
jgi:tRNA pseudouridine38-40 synthase